MNYHTKAVIIHECESLISLQGNALLFNTVFFIFCEPLSCATVALALSVIKKSIKASKNKHILNRKNASLTRS